MGNGDGFIIMVTCNINKTIVMLKMLMLLDLCNAISISLISYCFLPIIIFKLLLNLIGFCIIGSETARLLVRDTDTNYTHVDISWWPRTIRTAQISIEICVSLSVPYPPNRLVF